MRETGTVQESSLPGVFSSPCVSKRSLHRALISSKFYANTGPLRELSPVVLIFIQMHEASLQIRKLFSLFSFFFSNSFWRS